MHQEHVLYICTHILDTCSQILGQKKKTVPTSTYCMVFSVSDARVPYSMQRENRTRSVARG